MLYILTVEEDIQILKTPAEVHNKQVNACAVCRCADSGSYLIHWSEDIHNVLAGIIDNKASDRGRVSICRLSVDCID